MVTIQLHLFTFEFLSAVPRAERMATQNVVSSGRPARKRQETCQTGPKDGHSVTKRLQQDLMTLMVCINSPPL